MVRIGISAARSAMKSNPPSATSGSRVAAQNARTWGSIAFIRIGLKTRLSKPRWTEWAGGSSNRMMPGGISTPSCFTAWMTSSTEPLPEM
jgi:hypothetical protein